MDFFIVVDNGEGVGVYGDIESVGVWGPRWDCGRCRVVGANTVYLSQAINLLAGCNFKTLVNRYRVEHICQEAERTNRDIEDIANDYRFWSRSTLYDVFKTHTGLTPRQYMASMTERQGTEADTPRPGMENKG
ncbi:MAG: helix-turn-helix domain-containing protein [bacterium]|nr:helix-turn-helix domain-containing protein [bacterium]